MERVNIIGGGIGGLTLANALQQQEIDFRLFEQAHRISEIGAAISMSKAALDILDKLGLGSAVRDAGYETRHFHVADRHLKIIRRITTQFPVTIIHRAKLVDILVAKLPAVKINLNARLTSIQNMREYAELRFADSVTIRSACTAIADGIHSVSRKQVFPGIQVRYAGQVIWRGISQIDWPAELKHTYTEIWSGTKRFLFVPMNAEKVFWLAIRNIPPGGTDNPETIREQLLEAFQDFHPFVQQLLHKSSNFIRSDLADLGSGSRSWHQDRIVFLGDSIHATTPNLAQGGCQAIEDAYCLALLMKKSVDDLPAVFSEYQRLREKKVRFIVDTSWNMGKMSRNTASASFARLLFKHLPNSAAIGLENRLNDLAYLNHLL